MRPSTRVSLAVLGGLVLAAALLTIEGRVAARELRAAGENLATAREAIVAGDVEALRTAVRRADEHVAVAAEHVDGPVWGALRITPLVGGSGRFARHVVSVAESASEMAALVADEAERIVGPEGQLGGEITGGRVDLDAVRTVHAVLSTLPLEELEAAQSRLVATGTDWLPGSGDSVRDDVMDVASEFALSVRNARALAGVLPELLGADAPRRYLVAVQNSAELRGTGGLLGPLTVLTADGGRLTVAPAVDHEDPASPLNDPGAPGVDAPPRFVDRYGAFGATRLLANANLDPDLPTVAPVLLDLYEQRMGPRLDGVIAIDPVGLAQILLAVGPVDLPDELTEDPRIPDPVPPEQLPAVAMVASYDVFGGPTEERRAFLSALVDAALSRLLEGGGDTLALSRALGEAIGTRHLQLYSRDAAVQAVLAEAGAGGALAPRPLPGWERADVFAATVSNAAANKQDVHVGHVLDWDLELEVLGEASDGTVAARRDVRSEVAVVNRVPLDGDHHEWITGSARPGQAFEEGLRGEVGLNRSWWTIWSPLGARVRSGTTLDGEPVSVGTDPIRRTLAVDEFVPVSAGDRGGFHLEQSGTAVLVPDGDDLLYRATFWRQAKAVRDELSVSITAPSGWRIVDADITGGAAGPRLAPVPDVLGGPLRLAPSSTGTRLRLRGEVGSDVHVELRLRRR